MSKTNKAVNFKELEDDFIKLKWIIFMIGKLVTLFI
jgi:hypothetical protein